MKKDATPPHRAKRTSGHGRLPGRSKLADILVIIVHSGGKRPGQGGGWGPILLLLLRLAAAAVALWEVLDGAGWF